MINRPDPARAAELSAILAQRYPSARPYMLARAVVDAVRLARYYKKRAEIECTYNMTEENINRAAKRIERAAERVNRDLVSAIYGDGLTAVDTKTVRNAPRFEFGGDPRGFCGRLHIPGMCGDAWGGDGFPLY